MTFTLKTDSNPNLWQISTKTFSLEGGLKICIAQKVTRIQKQNKNLATRLSQISRNLFENKEKRK